MKLARLQWELAKRKELSEEAEKEEVRSDHLSEKKISNLRPKTPFPVTSQPHHNILQNERDGLEMAIRQREERLRELQPQLKAVIESTKPVQVSCRLSQHQILIRHLTAGVSQSASGPQARTEQAGSAFASTTLYLLQSGLSEVFLLCTFHNLVLSILGFSLC